MQTPVGGIDAGMHKHVQSDSISTMRRVGTSFVRTIDRRVSFFMVVQGSLSFTSVGAPLVRAFECPDRCVNLPVVVHAVASFTHVVAPFIVTFEGKLGCMNLHVSVQRAFAFTGIGTPFMCAFEGTIIRVHNRMWFQIPTTFGNVGAAWVRACISLGGLHFNL